MYPEISIKVENYKQHNSAGLRLRICIKQYEYSEEKIYKEFLDTIGGKFNQHPVQDTKDDNLKMKLSKNCCVIQLAEVEKIMFILSPDGNLTITGMNVKVGKMTLIGKIITNSSYINCQLLEVSADQSFCNKGYIEAEKIKFQGKGEFTNLKSIRSQKSAHIFMQGGVRNKGLLQSQDLRIETKNLLNEGHILTSNAKIKFKSELINLGNIVTDSDLNLKLIVTKKEKLHKGATTGYEFGKIYNRGKIFSKSRICASGIEFENRGEMAADMMHILSINSQKNHGIYTCKAITLHSRRGNIENSGNILADRFLLLNEVGDLINKGRILIADAFKICTFGKIENFKDIIVKTGKIDLISFNKIMHQVGSRLLASNTCIKTLDSQEVSGEISATNLDSKSVQETIINREGTVNASNVSMISLKDIINRGVLQGDIVYLKAYEEFINEHNVEGNELNIIARVVKNSASIRSTGKLDIDAVLCIHQLYGAELSSVAAISLKVLGELLNEGTIEAANLSVSASSIIKNSNFIYADSINMHSTLFENTLSGIIKAGLKLNLFSTLTSNSGLIQSSGQLSILSRLINNYETGKILSHSELSLLSGYVLRNIGQIYSNDKLIIEAVTWLKNTGNISSDSEIKLSAERFENFNLVSSNKIYIKILDALSNHMNGKIAAESALEIIAHSVMYNDGQVASNANLKIDVGLILENKGKLNAREKLQLINAILVKNTGEIHCNELEVFVKNVLMNNGNITARDMIILISQFALENSGYIISSKIHIEAKQLLTNTLTGQIRAIQELKLNTQGLHSNSGILESENYLNIVADCINNLSTGRITCQGLLELFSKNSILHSGSIKAKQAIMNAVTLQVLGKIKVETLRCQAIETFKLHREGLISAKQAVDVLCRNLCLFGKIVGSGKYNFDIQILDYDENTRWLCESLKLVLRQGYNFTKPIHLLGELLLETKKDIIISTTIEAGKGFEVFAKNLKVLEGGICTEGELKAFISNILQIGQSEDANFIAKQQKPCYLIGKQQMTLDAGQMVLAGDVYTASDLYLRARETICNSGNISAKGHLLIDSPEFYSHLNGKPSSVIVGKDCSINGNASFYYSDFHVGGKINTNGCLETYSFAGDAYNAALTALKKKAKKQKTKQIVGALASIAVAYFCPVLLGNFSSLAQTMLNGGISTLTNRKNPLESMAKAAFFAGFGNVLGKALEATNFSKSIVSDILINVARTGMHTVIEGDSKQFAKNILINLGGSVITQFSLPLTGDSQNINNFKEFYTNVGDLLAKTILNAGYMTLVKKNNLKDNLFTAGIQSLQEFSEKQGIKQREQSQIMKQTRITEKTKDDTKSPLMASPLLLSRRRRYGDSKKETLNNPLGVAKRSSTSKTLIQRQTHGLAAKNEKQNDYQYLNSNFKAKTARVALDKNVKGIIQNRDLQSQRFSKPLRRRLLEKNRSVFNHSAEIKKDTELLFSFSEDRYRHEISPGVTAGNSLYSYVQTTKKYSNSAKSHVCGFNISAALGQNLLEGELQTDMGELRFNVDRLSMHGAAGFEFENNDGRFSGQISANAMASVASAKARVDLPEVEIAASKFQCAIDVQGFLLGAGIAAEAGISLNKTKPGGQLFWGAGAILGPAGAHVKLNCKWEENELKEELPLQAPMIPGNSLKSGWVK